MAREIAVDDLVIEMIGRARGDRMRPRADERQIAPEDDVEELRQLIERRFADEAADACHTRVVAGDQLFGAVIKLIHIHRAEFVNFDQLVVETIAALPEEHGTG